MMVASLAAAVPCLGILFGWQPMPDDPEQYEVIVAVDPQLARLLIQGQSIPVEVDIPDDIQPVGRVRVVVGDDPAPRRRRVAALKPIIDPEVAARLEVSETDDAAGQGIQLTQYTGGPAAAGDAGLGRYGTPRYGQPAATPPGAATASNPGGSGAGAAVRNPFAQPRGPIVDDLRSAAGAAVQGAQQQVEGWTQGQIGQLQNQVRGATDQLLGAAQQTTNDAVQRVRNAAPGVRQLFGDAGAGSASTGADRANPFQRVGEALEQAVLPRAGDRSAGLAKDNNAAPGPIRSAAEEIGQRTWDFFDHLGRPIRRLADPSGVGVAAAPPPGNEIRPDGSPPPNHKATSRNLWNDPAGAPLTGVGEIRPDGPLDSRSGPAAARTPTLRRERIDQPFNPRAADASSTSSNNRPGSTNVADNRAAPWSNSTNSPYAWGDNGTRSTESADRWSQGDAGPQIPGLGAPAIAAPRSENTPPSIREEMLRGRADEPLDEVGLVGAGAAWDDGADSRDTRLTGDLGATPTGGGLWSPDGETAPFNAPVSIGAAGPTAEDGRPGVEAFGWDQRQHDVSRQESFADARNQPGQPAASEAGSSDADASHALGLLMAWLLLSGSLAANVYLVWSYLDVRNKYTSLVRKTARAVGGRFAAA